MATDPGASVAASSTGGASDLSDSSSLASILSSIDRDARLSLSDIYRSLPSPSVPPGLEVPQPDDIHTPLFAYQLRSLSLMLLREQPSRPGAGPRYLSVNGRTVDTDTQLPLDAESSLEVDYIKCQAVNGGILSEEMGAGKTLITLACILSTRGSLPHHDTREVFSNLCHVYKGVGATSKRGGKADVDRSHRRLAPLTALASHVLGQNGYTNADDPHGVVPPPLRALIDESAPYYLLTAPPPARKPRVALPELSMKVFLSPATLVVVPRTLLTQWRDEIRKHVRPEAKLRLLVLDDGSGEIPRAEELASGWDVILLTHSRFGAEESGGALQVRWPGVPRKCQCPYIGASRTVDCRCPPPPKLEPQASPLLQCKFRRLVIDEGNVVSGSSGLVKLAARLACQSRWIVSGTPTELMTGAAGEVLTTGLEDGEELASSQSEKREEVPFEERPLAPLTDAEANDLRRLKALAVDFLRLAPFWSSPDEPLPPHRLLDWNTAVMAPLKAQSFGARTRLQNIMAAVMIRNRPCDLLSLPPLHQRTVKLPFTRRERLTHNALLCLVSINAELSEREGKQWFFHHVNKKFLHEIMTNLALSCFHFGSETLAKNAADALGRAREGAEKLRKKGEKVPQALLDAIDELEEAVNDEEWRWGQSEYVRFSTLLDDEVRKAFDSSSPSAWRDSDGKPLLKADEICAMQMCAEKVLRKAAEVGARKGWGEEEVREEVVTAGERWKRGAVVRAEKKAEGSGSSSGGAARATTTTTTTSSSTTNGAPTSSAQAPALDPTLIPRDLAQASLLGASSTKVIRILDLVLRLPAGDKVIIFSDLSSVLYELAGALQTCGVGASYHASGQAQARRDEAIGRFKTDPDVRVLLMGARVGGRGIDLSCANHVVFVGPVGDAALKLQALKRAYRTGQGKETHVTTFVMQGSFEDQLAASGPRRGRSAGSAAAAAATATASATAKGKRSGRIEEGKGEKDAAKELLNTDPLGDDEEMRMRRVLLYPKLAKAQRCEMVEGGGSGSGSGSRKGRGIVALHGPAAIFPKLRSAKGFPAQGGTSTEEEEREREVPQPLPVKEEQSDRPQRASITSSDSSANPGPDLAAPATAPSIPIHPPMTSADPTSATTRSRPHPSLSPIAALSRSHPLSNGSNGSGGIETHMTPGLKPGPTMGMGMEGGEKQEKTARGEAPLFAAGANGAGESGLGQGSEEKRGEWDSASQSHGGKMEVGDEGGSGREGRMDGRRSVGGVRESEAEERGQLSQQEHSETRPSREQHKASTLGGELEKGNNKRGAEGPLERDAAEGEEPIRKKKKKAVAFAV